MKKTTILMCFIALVSFGISAQTNVTSNITTNTTFTAAGSPYIIVNTVTVSSGVTLTVESGVTVAFNAGRYLQVNGTLNATSALFTGNNGVTKGFWSGLHVASIGSTTSGDINLTNCTVEHATYLGIQKGQLTLNGCVVNNFSDAGVKIGSSGTLNINNTTISNTAKPISYTGEGVLNPGADVVFTNNTLNFIGIDIAGSTTVSTMLVLKSFGYPYLCNSNLKIGSAGTLQIDAGATLLMNSGAQIQVDGIFKALGTQANPVVLDKFPGAQNWNGISFNNSSVDEACIMQYCIVKNAVANSGYSALLIENASPTIHHCTFTNNPYNLLLLGNSQPIFSNNLFDKSTLNVGEVCNIRMEADAKPSFTSDTLLFNNQEIRAIQLKASTVSTNAQLKKLSFNGINNITYYLDGNTTIQAGASLTIHPGVVIKCRYNSSQIIADGVLTGIGTSSEPIIFTHINDDSYGNPMDSQNDGSQTYGATSGKIFLNSAQLSKLEHWVFNAGPDLNSWAVTVRNNNVVTNCEFKNMGNAVLFSQNAQVTNNHFVNISQFPVGYFISNGTPTLTGNTLTNVAYSGIQLDGVDTNSPTLKKMSFAGMPNAPYIVSKNITIGQGNLLQIEPGVIVKSLKFNSYSWTINGAMKALGLNNEKIIFTSIYDDSVIGDTNNDGTTTIPTKGDWCGFHFTPTASATDNILQHVELRYSGRFGSGNSYPVVNVTDTKILLDRVKISFASQCGVGMYGTAYPEIKDCEFSNITNEPLYMDISANPTFSGANSLANVGNIGIRLKGGVVSGTVKSLNFAGYDNISYFTNETFTINNELTIPAGLVFKGNGLWNVNGKLNVLGAASNPVVFTDIDDDAYGNPNDGQQNSNTTPGNYGGYVIFSASSNPSSVIDNAIFRYSYQSPIQLVNASSTISNSRFENSNTNGLSLSGTSAPVVTNCTFHNIAFPMTTSLLAYPSATSGNSITGTTTKALRITNETLNQNATLTKRNFAGITNIPYVFHQYTIGTSAVLTINPGVILKFMSNGYLSVKNGLMVNGGALPDDAVVFTADRDNFYGGITANDNTTLPWTYYWQGIYFYDEAIDANCVLNNIIIKYASKISSEYGALTLNNASPTIKNSRFDMNYFGVVANSASLPTIQNCDFLNTEKTYGYAIKNNSATNTITVSDSWFNSATGPTHSSNPAGKGERVSDNVVFTPFASQLLKAEMGDVSLNGSINPYDASLILQHNVGNTTLNSSQLVVADVSRNGNVSSYDASMILQYTVGLIPIFTPNPNQINRPKRVSGKADTDIIVAEVRVAGNDNEFVVPVSLLTGDGVKSMDLRFTFNPEHIQFQRLQFDRPQLSIAHSEQTDDGKLALSMASAYDLAFHNDSAYLIFKVKNPLIGSSDFELISAYANETKLTPTGAIVSIQSNKIITGNETIQALNQVAIRVAPDKILIDYVANEQVNVMNIRLLNLAGSTIASKSVCSLPAGRQTVEIAKPADANGVYIIQIQADGMNYAKKIVIRN